MIFVLFSPLWWTLLLVASIGIIYSSELEENAGAWSTTCFVVAVALLCFFGQPTLPELLMVNPLWFIGACFGTYILGSCIYGLTRWWWFCCQKHDEYEQVKLTWLREKNVSDRDVPDALKTEFGDYLIEYCGTSVAMQKGHDKWKKSVWLDYAEGNRVTIDPRIRPWDYANKIFLWMAYWPWSLFWTLCHDMIVNFFTWLRKSLVNMMDGISKSVFRNVGNDFKIEPKGKKKNDR